MIVYILIALIIIVVTYLIVQKMITNKQEVIMIEHESSTHGDLELDYSDILDIKKTTSEELKENELRLIKDENIIRRISRVIPKSIVKTTELVEGKNKSVKDLYKVVIPSGETLTKSKNKNSFRAITKNKNGKISGHADLVKVNPRNINKTSRMVSNLMDINSIIVGEYQMAEINKELKEISQDISKVSDFQEVEFKSKIISILPQIEEISNFNIQVLDSDDIRNNELIHLQNLLSSSSQLLEQVNITIEKIANKNNKMDYIDYENEILGINTLLEQQDILITVLKKISELREVLSKGTMSREKCYFVYNQFFKRYEETRITLKMWHEIQCSFLQIDLDKKRFKKRGVISNISGIVNEKWSYSQVNDPTHKNILRQKELDIPKSLNISNDMYEGDLEIAFVDGNYYQVIKKQ